MSWPGGVLVSSVFFSDFATKEFLKGRIGCAGLLDTNVTSRYCNLAIPCNDDSIDWIVFINDVFSEYILVKKLMGLLNWHYLVIKKKDRFIFFEKWLSKKVAGYSLRFSDQCFSRKFSYYSLFFFPLWFISSYNQAFFGSIEKLSVSFPNINFNETTKIFENLFSEMSMRKKLFLISFSASTYYRSLFFNFDRFFFSPSFFSDLLWVFLLL